MIRRFTIRVILISIAATLVWWATRDYVGPTTVMGAKWLHAVAGYPVPCLQADEQDYFWFAPMFPPLVGLVLASTWIPWRRRFAGLAIGLLGFWYVVSLQVAIVYTPYLTQSEFRAYLVQIQIGLNTVVYPVMLWLIVTGGPPRGWSLDPAEQDRSKKRTPRRRVAVASALALLFCALCTLPVLPADERRNANWVSARNRLARAIATYNAPSAVKAVDTLLVEDPRNAALNYLRGKLQSRGHDPAPRLQP